ncbi:MAG: DNA polymerase I [Parcubacteria group bacterium Gr01-1014_20]|nr:MAG: DNA polymerase I [Parcubacteria group bacterium Gr01-1014_20]
MKTLLLIDANSLIHRAFHALPPLNAPDGRATQALYGISSVIIKIFREAKPDYAAALFDRPEPTFRKEKFKEYKAHRPKAPDDLISQIIEAKNLFQKFGIRFFEKPGFEADDLIATLATKFSSKGGSSSGGKDSLDLQVVILTGDLDTLQIVEGEKLVVRTFKKGISETMTYTEEAVKERYGLEPKQLTDYKALVGDQSDNIPGVMGVGEKTATSLLQKYGNLENVYKNLDKEPKLGKKLVGTEKEAEFSKSLVILEKQAPIEVKDIKELEIVENGADLEAYLHSLGFESLVKRFLANNANKKSEKEESATIPEFRKPKGSGGSKVSTGQASIFSSGGGSAFGGGLKAEDFENHEDRVFVFEGDQGNKEYLSKKLKVGFGLKKMLKDLWVNRRDLLPPFFDLGVAFWMIDTDFKDYEDPEAVAKKFLNINWKGEPEDYEKLLSFCTKRIKEYEVEDVFKNIEMPLLPVLAEMEKNGILVSREKLQTLEGKIQKEIDSLEGRIYGAAGEEFNINSPKQLGQILFEKLGINSKRAKKTSGGAVSTREESLAEFRGEHGIINLILEYRENFKIQTTYVKALQGLVGEDGRVHTEFVQTGAATGRLSSRNPNLQNVPQESKWSRDLRAVFEAPKGFSLLSFDYSQIELRVFAAVAQDQTMIEAFKKGVDIHTLTASKVLGVRLDEVSKEDRRLAKALNFGLLYGMGVAAFAKSSGLTRDKAKEFVDAYFREFSEIRDWQEKTKQETRKFGYTKTLTGRRRYLPAINSFAQQFAAEAERAAINHPLQGLAADIMKMAMIRVKNKLLLDGLWNNKVRMLLTIHDELLFEAADDMIKDVSDIVKKEMEGVFDLGVPLRVGVSAGKDWGNLEQSS